MLAEAGRPQQVHAHVVNMMFHTKGYDGFTLPAGMYDAVRIELGQAAGHNWFCVLFPPLCVPAAADADDGPAYPQEEKTAVRTPVQGEVCGPGMVAAPVGRGLMPAGQCCKLHRTSLPSGADSCKNAERGILC